MVIPVAIADAGGEGLMVILVRGKANLYKLLVVWSG